MNSTTSRAIIAAAAATGAAVAIAVAIGALAVTISACREDRPAAPAAAYTVRGQVGSVVAEDGKVTAYIHHEAIPTFANRKGEAVGMPSMTMPFGVAAAVSLDGVAAGDKVEITFDVVWTRRPTAQITALKKLPADTPLELRGM